MPDPKRTPPLWTKPLFHWVFSSQAPSVQEEPRFLPRLCPSLEVDSEEVTEQQSSCFPVITAFPHGYDTRNPLCLEGHDLICSQQNVIYPSIDIFRKSSQNQVLLNVIFHCKGWGSLLSSDTVPLV